MINKEIDEIKLDDLQELVENSVRESKTIEYKKELPGNTDNNKKEFLADISAFANTASGDIIFGIDENNGIAKELTGIETDDIDSLLLRYENLIRDGIEPRIQVMPKAIELTDGTYMILLRVPKSWNSPHRVIYKGHDKFYGRNSAGKFQLDTNELRQAFTLSQSLVDEIKTFQTGRILEILANNYHVKLFEGAKLVLQIVPMESFGQPNNLTIETMKSLTTSMRPIYSSGWNTLVNIDGVMTYTGNEENGSYGYVQLFRNGTIEAVDALLLRPHEEGQYFLASQAYEDKILKSYSNYIQAIKGLEIGAPLLVFLTFTGIKGYELAVSPNKVMFREKTKLKMDTLSLPSIYVDNLDTDPITLFRPLFDMVWNAFGYDKSLNFDAEGNWIAK